MTVDLSAKIPNNVDLDGDPRLRRALEAWQPKFIEWWNERGPAVHRLADVYLRTAVDVGQDGFERQHHPRELTARGDAVERQRRFAHIW